MVTPTLEEARRLVGENTLLPVSIVLPADLKTPVEILRIIRALGKEAFILESAPDGESWGRYTFLGVEPRLTISGKDDTMTVRRRNGSAETKTGNLHSILKAFISAYKSPKIEGLPDFTGGFVGYFSYGYFKQAEPSLKLTAADDIGVADFHLMLFDRIIAFDFHKQKLHLIVNIETKNLEEQYAKGVAVLKDMENLILTNSAAPTPPSGAAGSFTASFTKEGFCTAVETAKAHIREGDIFQCVPSIRFKAEYNGDLLPVYRALRMINPSAYMFCIRFEGLEIAGASPETLVSLKNGIVNTYPLAGTCPRLPDEKETQKLIEELLQNEKELAEHDMLVDLGRNDLGKVCRFGTIAVEDYRSVKKLSHVCHIATTVTGRVAEDCDALGVMAAVLPAGTLSGAPKKRACEIIDQLEPSARGVYGGAVGYIDFTGNMDLCIGIRMAVLKNGQVYVQAGAGVVADSEPEKEYEECLRKAGAMMDAIELAGKAVYP